MIKTTRGKDFLGNTQPEGYLGGLMGSITKGIGKDWNKTGSDGKRWNW